MNRTLSKIRKLYGNTSEITVCIEELNELACVLCKYPRYRNHNKAVRALRHKVLDEYVDVCIILEHVKAVFSLSDTEIDTRYRAKMDRIKRWVDSSNKTPTQTLKDRAVIE